MTAKDKRLIRCSAFFLINFQITEFSRDFQSFETNQGIDPNPANYGHTGYPGSFYDPTVYAAPDPAYDPATSDFDNEPPLLEGNESIPFSSLSHQLQSITF